MNRVPLLARAVLVGLVVAVAIAACSPAASGSPVGPSTPTSTTPAATSGPTTTTNIPSQSDTEWGRIWDAVPASFPAPPGALPATDTGEGASSALLSIPAMTPAAIAEFYRSAFVRAGYRSDIDGPLEDASIEIRGSDEDQCVMLVTVLPTSSTNLVTVLYGAGCSFAGSDGAR